MESPSRTRSSSLGKCNFSLFPSPYRPQASTSPVFRFSPHDMLVSPRFPGAHVSGLLFVARSPLVFSLVTRSAISPACATSTFESSSPCAKKSYYFLPLLFYFKLRDLAGARHFLFLASERCLSPLLAWQLLSRRLGR